MDIINFLARGGGHERAIGKMFRGNVRFDGTAPVFDHPLYLLAFANRSGSNLLAEHLRSTPVFSGFYEQLNHDTVKEQAVKYSADSFPDLIRRTSEDLGRNGTFRHGFKASWDQMLMLLRFNIPAMYTGVRVIHITRGDVIGQAISYHIASQTKRWTTLHKGEDVEPVYNSRRISQLMQSTLDSAQAVEGLCTLFDLPRLHVTYEDVVARPTKSVMRIGRWAEVDLKRWKARTPEIQKQADAVNDGFRERFLTESRAGLLA